MKTNPNDTAQPVIKSKESSFHFTRKECMITYSEGGLTKLEHFAALATDDFDKFPISLQIDIVGVEPPHYTMLNETRAIYNLEYAIWLAKGRAIWKVMQAEALIETLNKEEQ